MPHDSDPPRAAPAAPRERCEWQDVRDAGCYLHLASGLIARVYAEDVAPGTTGDDRAGGGTVVRLDPNPGAPMEHLRRIAERHGLRLSA